MPLVSVVMPAHDAAGTLASSIRSVQAQSHPDWELLVTDDGSTDETWAMLTDAARLDSRIRPERSDRQLGAAGARNAAIRRARGAYVAFLDADDLWLADKLTKQLAFATEQHAPVTFTSYYKVAADFTGDARDFVPNGRVVPARAELTYATLLRQNYIGCLTGMYSVTALGKRFMPDLRKRQDYGLWLSLLRDGTVARGLDEPLALYRQQRAGSLSGSSRLSLVKYNWELYRRVERLSLPRSVWALGQATVRSTLKRRI
ncbi:glycosyltransferase family 2 protein [Ruania albidiflava]|uniref:glycosyltransferase family 2 protein n=1 Tax=Ruania albidiflava TaxID=366586 RepID=UPI0003B629DF|nr:glycosyltransferase family 2 protein [Ruania albidiflava]